MTTLYLVTAHRLTKSKHTYPVGIFSTPDVALEAATDEEDYRGGKYGCTIQTITLDGAAPADASGWPVIRHPPTVAAPASPEPVPTPAPAYPRRRTLRVTSSSPAWSSRRRPASFTRIFERTGLTVAYFDGVITAEPASLDQWLLLIAEVDALEAAP